MDTTTPANKLEQCREDALATIDIWTQAMGDRRDLAGEDMDLIAKAMGKDLPLRDAIICSTISDLTEDEIHRIVTRPRERATGEIVARAFGSAMLPPDDEDGIGRCDWAIGQLISTATRERDAERDELASQPIAAAGYINWVKGDLSTALRQGLDAIRLDDGNRLAAILIDAIMSGFRPRG